MANRPCGCGARGRHKATCSVKSVSIPQTHEDSDEIYTDAYGHPPKLAWSFNKGRQATVEKRLKRFIDKKKPFYLAVTKPDETIENWFIDGGNWTTTQQADGRYSGLVGHINNLLPFVKGRSMPIGELVVKKSAKRTKRK